MIAAALVAALAAQAGARPPPPEFLAGRARRGGWRMEAAIEVEVREPLPRLGARRCSIAGPGLRLAYAWSRPLTVELGGPGWGFSNADVVALEIGGIVYEAWMMPAAIARPRYNDVDYPHDFAEPAAAAAEAALVVRRAPADPWLSVATLTNDMFELRSIGVRYRAANGVARARVPVAGLAGAIGWCETVFRSDRAHTLPARLRGFVPR